MEAQPQKRIAVAIILGTLASVAFFLAQGTTGLLGAAFLRTGEGEFVAAASPAAIAAAAGGSGRKDDTSILTRNIFDHEQGSILTEEVEEEIVDPPVTDLDDVDPNHLPTCTGSVRLVAAVLNTRLPEWSFAAIVGAAGKAMLYRAGQAVDGNQLIAIRSESVVMEQSGRACRLGMFGVEEAAPVARPAVVAQAEERPTPPGRDEGNISASDMESGITRVSDTNFRVTRGLVDQVLANQAELMRTARVIPHEENGRVVGVKLYGIRRNSLLGRLGVQNGDMLRTINGFDMSSPDSALEAYARLREADNLTLSVVRRGQPMTIDYNIQ
ncbi:MAG: hypothetical protein CMN30_05985 [Sandaracinus sp.]|nr:hypothetical protein [Sandaracinus sp.]